MTRSGEAKGATATPSWSVGGLFLEALAVRDFDRMADCFTPEATMRALIPPGLTECEGAAQIVDNIRCWFGAAEAFEVLDGTVGEVGGRVHVSWRLRLHPTPWGDDSWHVIEQQAYLRAGDRIEAIDLLCSGFQPDTHA
ncbi:MAG: nuclear transport factor 2 family protein [Mycobacteriales bacterium]|nr:nuclear transport factor 2 family protein [Mycobacteriales bacterium]